jgi:hypothetical protein
MRPVWGAGFRADHGPSFHNPGKRTLADDSEIDGDKGVCQGLIDCGEQRIPTVEVRGLRSPEARLNTSLDRWRRLGNQCNRASPINLG